jgi:4-amino-4-deoxy-L-arabinose transferase-like glycosyltransferase
MFYILLSLTLGSFITFFRRINLFPLRNWDEAWYAEIIKNMASGKYGSLMPYWNGRYYFDNSPLYFWLSTPFFKFFGPGEWQARIVSATASIFVVIFIFLIGKKLVNVLTGSFAVLIFLTLGGVVMRFAHGNLDALLIFFSLGAFYFYLKSEDKKIYSLLCGLFLGLGVLVKSWGIGMFPLFLIVAYAFFKERRLPRNLHLILPVALASFGWWYILGFWKFGYQFASWYLLNPSENRLSNPFGNFSFDYFRFVIADIGLWFLVGFVFLLGKFQKRINLKTNFVFSFIFVSFIYITFLNFLSDKSGWYLIPVYPLIALIIGYWAARTYKLSPKLTVFIFAAILVFQTYNVNRIENIYPDRSLVGATLGQEANKLIPKGDTAILVDGDFTSFLYYSNKIAIYTLQDRKKPDEWWILTSSDLSTFLQNNPKAWIITKRPQDLNLVANKSYTSTIFSGYSFMKLY